MEPPEPESNRQKRIEQTVLEILKQADLNTATEHSVRTTAAERLAIDLSDLQSKLLVRNTLESFLLSTANAVQVSGNEQEQIKEVVIPEEHHQQQQQRRKRNNTALARGDSNDIVFKLSEKRRLTIQDNSGEPSISIRDFYEKDGKLLPSKNGISLTPCQWSALRSSFPLIEAAIVKMTSKTSSEGTGKSEAANPTSVTALTSPRNIPAERAEIEAHEKQTGIENPTERARFEADGKQTETADPTLVTALASEGHSPTERAHAEAGVACSAKAFTPRALVPIAPTRLNGKNYHCWMHQIVFYLNQLNIAYVLTDPYPSFSAAPEASFEETIQAKQKAQKWIDDDYICRQNILNYLDDHLFNKYSCKMNSAKELWEELKLAYGEVFQTKRSQVNKYMHFEMVDGVSVLEQVQELHKIADSIVASGIRLDEDLHVSAIISKLPPSWKQCQVKLMQEDFLPLNYLMYKLRDEEEVRDRRKQEERFKNTRVVNSNNNDKVGPRQKQTKIVCYSCGREGHKSNNCPRKFDSGERSTAKENRNAPVSSEVNTVEKAVK